MGYINQILKKYKYSIFKGDDLCHLPSPSYLAHLCTIGARGAPSASSKYIQLEAPGLGASFFVLKFVYFSDIDTV